MPEKNESTDFNHYHSANTLEEWVYAKVQYNDNEYESVLSDINGKLDFYEANYKDKSGQEYISQAPFCLTRVPIIIDGYTYQIAESSSIEAQIADMYFAAIGTNDTENCIVYVFAKSESFSFMGAELVLESILKAVK